MNLDRLVELHVGGGRVAAAAFRGQGPAKGDAVLQEGGRGIKNKRWPQLADGAIHQQPGSGLRASSIWTGYAVEVGDVAS